MRIYRTMRLAAALCATTTFTAINAIAQNASPPDDSRSRTDEPPPPPQKKVHATLSLGGEYGTSANFKDAPGDVSVARSEAKLNLTFPAGERGRVNVGLASEASFYNFDGATAFAPGFTEPWDDAFRHRLRFLYSRRASLHVAWFLSGYVSVAGEAGAKFQDSVTYGGYAGVNYLISDTLTLGLGVFASTQLEDDPTVFPFLTVDWEIVPGLTLSNTAEQGPGGQLAWKPFEDWTFVIGGEYAAREFRLDGDGAQPRGVGQDRRIRAYLGASWAATSQVTLSGRFGIDFHQEYELQSPAGNEVSQVDADPSAFLSLEVKFSF